MRSAIVYVKQTPAAELTEERRPGGRATYVLRYLPEYLERDGAGSVCTGLPRRKEAYEADSLFPYFESILPEGGLCTARVQGGKPGPT